MIASGGCCDDMVVGLVWLKGNCGGAAMVGVLLGRDMDEVLLLKVRLGVYERLEEELVRPPAEYGGCWSSSPSRPPPRAKGEAVRSGRRLLSLKLSANASWEWERERWEKRSWGGKESERLSLSGSVGLVLDCSRRELERLIF